jgi:hypothetical protein
VLVPVLRLIAVESLEARGRHGRWHVQKAAVARRNVDHMGGNLFALVMAWPKWKAWVLFQ